MVNSHKDKAEKKEARYKRICVLGFHLHKVQTTQLEVKVLAPLRDVVMGQEHEGSSGDVITCCFLT